MYQKTNEKIHKLDNDLVCSQVENNCEILQPKYKRKHDQNSEKISK